jgi:hypothetical protein
MRIKISRSLLRGMGGLAGSALAIASFEQAAVASPPPEPPIASGWAQAAGEVRIYPKRADLGKLYDGSCTSGFFKNGATLPEKLQNRRVRVYGSTMNRADLGAMTLRGETVGAENYCNSENILVITRVVRW